MKKFICAILAATSIFVASASADNEPSQAIKTAMAVEDAFAEVVDAAKGSVVVITNKQLNQAGWMQQNFSPEDFWDFFNAPNHRRQRRQPRSNVPEVAGKGSGVIISKDGYILTNYHVIKDAEYLEVKTADGSVYDNYTDSGAVTVVGYDEECDLAVLQLEEGKKNNFSALKFADSDKLRVGQWAIAIGAPFDLDYSVTIGCVSQKGRTDMGMSAFDNYIQTDASINPGNSGGPLLNIRGEIIGINQFIVTGGYSKGSIGIGFAIASNLAKQVADSLIKDGEVIRPFIGISMQELTKQLKGELDIEYGVLVREVIPGEAAEKAGVQAGDVIQSVGGHPVKSSHELLDEITKHQPDEEIKLGIIRDGKHKEIKVKAGRRNDYYANGKMGRKPHHRNEAPLHKLGLALEEQGGKVYVAEVLPGGAAEKAGIDNDDRIQPGDVILDINRIPVKSASDVTTALKTLKKNTVILYLERELQNGQNYRYFIAVSL